MTGSSGLAAGFHEHLAHAVALSDALAASHCLPSGRFDARAQETVRSLEPLLSLWVPEILLVLRIHGAQRFNAVKAKLEPVSSRVLTDKLRHLEAHQLIVRQETGGHHTYTLTPHGHTLTSLLHPLLHYLRNATPVTDPPADTRT